MAQCSSWGGGGSPMESLLVCAAQARVEGVHSDWWDDLENTLLKLMPVWTQRQIREKEG